METLMMFLAAMSIPSAITGFCFWILERKIAKRENNIEQNMARVEAERDKKDESRKQNEIIIIEGVTASLALGEATARAVERIPDANCNGDMHSALEYATEVKNKHKDFLIEQGIKAIY